MRNGARLGTPCPIERSGARSDMYREKDGKSVVGADHRGSFILILTLQ